VAGILHELPSKNGIGDADRVFLKRDLGFERP
jgi:hypothetical protein